jgi:hypothetical protein
LLSIPLIFSSIDATASIVSTMPLRACGCHTSYLLLSSSRPLFFWLCVGLHRCRGKLHGSLCLSVGLALIDAGGWIPGSRNLGCCWVSLIAGFLTGSLWCPVWAKFRIQKLQISLESKTFTTSECAAFRTKYIWHVCMVVVLTFFFPPHLLNLQTFARLVHVVECVSRMNARAFFLLLTIFEPSRPLGLLIYCSVSQCSVCRLSADLHYYWVFLFTLETWKKNLGCMCSYNGLPKIFGCWWSQWGVVVAQWLPPNFLCG